MVEEIKKDAASKGVDTSMRTSVKKTNEIVVNVTPGKTRQAIVIDVKSPKLIQAPGRDVPATFDGEGNLQEASHFTLDKGFSQYAFEPPSFA